MRLREKKRNRGARVLLDQLFQLQPKESKGEHRGKN